MFTFQSKSYKVYISRYINIKLSKKTGKYMKKSEKLDFIPIMERVKHLKGIKYDYQVAKLLGLREKAYSARKKSGSIPFDKLQIFCRVEGISYDWLVSEEDGARLAPDPHLSENIHPEGMVQVNYSSVRWGLKPGAPPNFSQEIPFLFINNQAWLNLKGPIKAFSIEGVTSSPHVKNEDIILVACGEKKIKGQHLYAIRTNFYLDVRHCHIDENLLLIAPNNPGERIETFDLTESPNPVVGQLVGIIKNSTSNHIA
jgi:hypothetical protein